MSRVGTVGSTTLGRVVVIALFGSVMFGIGTSLESGDGRHRSTIHGVPVLLDSIKRAGAPIADGFEVAKGSVLLGRVFPTYAEQLGYGDQVEHHGWRAELLVTGDPVAVLQRYQEQGVTVGIPASADATAACRSDPYFDGIGCWMYELVEAPPSTRVLTMQLARRFAGSGIPAESIMTLSYSEIVGQIQVPDLVREVARQTYGSTGTPMVPLPEEWPPLPSAGHRFAQGLPEPKGLRLVNGSELVAPVWSGCTGGFKAMLRVRRDPRMIIANYAQQFKELGFEVSRNKSHKGYEEERHDESTIILKTNLTGDGDGNLDAVAFIQRGKPTYMMIERCPDA